MKIIMKNNKKRLKITILRPSGNDTALIEGLVEKAKRKSINDAILKRFPKVEQVGFYEYDKQKNLARLEMAGGEFCGNATRSLAYLLLNGKRGTTVIKASGAKKLLKAGVNKSNFAYAEMPIYKTSNSITQLSSSLYQVRLEGIVHLITPNNQSYSKPKLKKEARRLLKKTALLYSQPASGVMFVDSSKEMINLQPVVWVRDIQTLFCETACASGTTAVGLWKMKDLELKNASFEILQPSKQCIKVFIEKEGKRFKTAIIDGPIKIVAVKEVVL